MQFSSKTRTRLCSQESSHLVCSAFQFNSASTYCVPGSGPDNEDFSRYNKDQDMAFLPRRNLCYSQKDNHVFTQFNVVNVIKLA